MENWTVVYAGAYPSEVYMAKNLLETEGIETFIKDELTSQVIGFSTALGGVKLMVHENDAPRALELLTAGGYIEP